MIIPLNLMCHAKLSCLLPLAGTFFSGYCLLALVVPNFWSDLIGEEINTSWLWTDSSLACSSAVRGVHNARANPFHPSNESTSTDFCACYAQLFAKAINFNDETTCWDVPFNSWRGSQRGHPICKRSFNTGIMMVGITPHWIFQGSGRLEGFE